MKSDEPDLAAEPQGLNVRILLALMLAHLAINSAMAGQRMAAPLQALQAGHETWAVGVLVALFSAVAIFSSLGAGRLSDRLGYHQPLRLGVALVVLGAALSVASNWLSSWPQLLLLFVAAAVSGAGSNLASIATLLVAGRLAANGTERLRVFSWMGLAPSFANAVGPVLAGLLIDTLGFAWAYSSLLVLPLLALWTARVVPVQSVLHAASVRENLTDLLATPGIKRLILVNWALSASWDVHSFAVPILGHARHFSALTVGLVLAAFTISVVVVRLVVPFLAHRIDEVKLLCTAMLVTGAVFIAYPFVTSPFGMGLCAAALGLTLGAVQPTVMTMLHRLSPQGRHGEAMALRSMVISVSNTLMPLAFGALGTLFGPGVMFWMMGAAVASGSWPARRLSDFPR